MGSVIFEATEVVYDDSVSEWLVDFSVPSAGNDGGTLAVVNSREAAEALAKVLNAAARLADNGRFP